MFKNLLGDPNARKLRKFQPWVADINILEEDIRALSDDGLRGKTAEFQQRLAKAKSLNEEKEILDEILPEAFAVVREAGQRVLGMRHLMFNSSGALSCTKAKLPK